MKQIKIMESTPNTLQTLDCMLLLAYNLHERTGYHYNVQCDFQNNKVILWKEVTEEND